MSRRDEILAGLKQARYEGEALPGFTGFGERYDDVIAQFELSLQAVGGTLLRASTTQDAAQQVAELEVVKQADRIVSRLPELLEGNLELTDVSDARELDQLSVAAVPGVFAVAENGAVWIDPSDLLHRSVLFIAEHLIVVVRESQLVHNMHQAYRRLGADLPGYGLFVSGPSKTADIEQSLVIGAQGPRSLHVVMVGE